MVAAGLVTDRAAAIGSQGTEIATGTTETGIVTGTTTEIVATEMAEAATEMGSSREVVLMNRRLVTFEAAATPASAPSSKPSSTRSSTSVSTRSASPAFVRGVLCVSCVCFLLVLTPRGWYTRRAYANSIRQMVEERLGVAPQSGVVEATFLGRLSMDEIYAEAERRNVRYVLMVSGKHERNSTVDVTFIQRGRPKCTRGLLDLDLVARCGSTHISFLPFRPLQRQSVM